MTRANAVHPIRAWFAARDRWTYLRFGLALGYAIALSGLSIVQWASFRLFDADLAINDQLVWNASRGRPFASTLIEHADISLGDHFAFFQLYLAPLYWLWSDPRTLLIAQSVLLAAAAFPLGWIADQRLGRRWLGTVVVAAFLLYPPLHYLNLVEYHEVAPAVTAMAWLLWAIETHRSKAFVPLALLALSVKEEMAILCVAVGGYALFVKRRRALGAGLVALSLAWGIVAMGIVMPALNTAGGGFYYLRRYSQYGDSAPAILMYLAGHPWVIFADLFGPGRPAYYAAMLGPVLFLPLFAPSVLAIALPAFAYLALGNSPAQYSIQYQYQAPIIAVVFVAAIAGLARLQSWGLRPGALAGLLGTGSVGGFLLLSPVPPGRAFDPSRYDGGAHAALVQRYLALVPPGVPASAGRNLVSRLSRRERVYNFPNLGDAAYVLLDWKGQVYPGFFEDDGNALSAFVRDPRYWLVSAEDGVWLFQRGAPAPPAPSHPVGVNIDDQFRLLGYDLQPDQSGDYRLTLWWSALRRPDDRYAVFVQLLDRTGTRVWQHDSEPLDGLLPTIEWPAGRAIPDRRRLELGGLPAGEYRLLVGMYESGGGDSLPIPASWDTPFPNAMILGPFTYPAGDRK